jgi:hypothetical protein
VKTAALVVLVILGGLLEMWLDLAAQNHPLRVGIVGGVVLLVAAAVVFLFPSGWPTVALVVIGISWLIGLFSGLDARDHELGYYCKYGATSQAQLDDCMASVTTDDIEKLETPAARFAYGETTECGRGSGPFCPKAAKEVAHE